MKFPAYDHKLIATEILKYWQEQKIVDKLRQRNKEGKKFYFLEGPPYTSGKVHLGTAWNMGLKDMVLRYKRAQGLKVWDRMGYDMHGLPTEQKVMKKLNLKNKEEIDNYGVKEFTDECEKFCKEMMELMNQDFINMGATLDFSNPYQPISKEFINGEWWLLKKAYEDDRLYQGLRTMHWDAATQTSVAKHELEYKQLRDTSIFVKFQDKEDSQKYYIIWTTTPWTIPLNLAVMVNPELEYVEVEVKQNNGENHGDKENQTETWVVAKNLVKSVMQKAEIEEDDYEIKKTFRGAELEGKKYNHPLNILELLPESLQQNEKLFSILISKEHVDDSAGTGLVHSAPGCGPEDYEVGHQNGIPPFNCVNEEGLFSNFGNFTGWKAKTDDAKFIAAIDQADALVAKESYVHDYPHGERSHEPVIFRTTKQWFFKVEDLKQQMLENNKEIYWHPQAAKNAFNSWLENLRDNSITKQRYWGTPVPIWKAVEEKKDDKENKNNNSKEKDSHGFEKPDVIVIGSVEELEQLSGQKVNKLHIPEIDRITISKDGKTYKRIPDVLDVWIDAGTASWNCLDYPENKEIFKEFFPADFILEGKDQIRGWFNLLMVASTLGFNKAPFKNVFMHGFLNDSSGVKMSKSLGNIITPDELIEKHGADVMRYYMSQTSAGEDNNFSWDECVVKSRNLLIIWNVHKLLINLCKENNLNPKELEKDHVEEWLEEKHINSLLHSTIKKVTELMEAYKLDEVIQPLENLFLQLSRTYIQATRDKAATGSVEEKKAVVKNIYNVLMEGLKMFSIVAPFISEAIFLNLKQEFNLEQESISHHTWPKVDENKIDSELENNMQVMQEIVTAALSAREKAKLGLRWPVKEIIIASRNEQVINSTAALSTIIQKETNAKVVNVVNELQGIQKTIKPDLARIGKSFGKLSKEIIQYINSNGQEIMQGIEETGRYSCMILEKKIDLLKEHLTIEKQIPAPYVGGDARNAAVYVNTTRTEELETEGYVRELTRQIQQLRKKAGMEKKQRIDLSISMNQDMKTRIESYSKDIKEKVGADKLNLMSLSDEGKDETNFAHTSEIKVKQESFSIKFS